MCGIVYSKSFTGKPVAKTIKKKYKGQRSRGYEGFGFYMPETNRLTHNPREGRAMTLLRREKEATEILFHHRFPTSTENVRNACHPFSTKNYFTHNYVGVHNGVLWNEKILKAKHEELGIKYVSEMKDGSFNDSEALIYDLAMYIEGKVDYVSAVGSIAFIMVQRDKKGKATNLYFGRNEGNPLIMQHDKKKLTLSSQGNGEVVEPHTMHRFNYATGQITKTACFIQEGYSKSSYCYDYNEDDYITDLNRNFGFDSLGRPTSDSTKRYFEDDNIEFYTPTDLEYDRLLFEADNDFENALSLGEWELGELEKLADKIQDKIDIFENATEDDMDRYNTIDDEIYALTKAIERLRREVLGVTQMGFRLPLGEDLLTDGIKKVSKN